MVVKVFPKHDEKVQLGPYDKRLTGKSKEPSMNFKSGADLGEASHHLQLFLCA